MKGREDCNGSSAEEPEMVVGGWIWGNREKRESQRVSCYRAGDKTGGRVYLRKSREHGCLTSG